MRIQPFFQHFNYTLSIKFLVVLIYLLSSACLADVNIIPEATGVSGTFSIINDNYTGTMERGEKGYYIGPDDFITATFLARIYWQDWKIAVTENVLTSRHFKYRYDLLFASVARQFSFGNLNLRPELGILIKGRLGGETIQNWFHRLKAIRELFLPYQKGGITAFVAGTVEYQKQLHFKQLAIFYSALELRLPLDFVPVRISPHIGYQTELMKDRLQIELLAGWRFFLNKIPEYSELIKPGPIVALSTKSRIYRKFYFEFGFSFFPARNLENDPGYKAKSHDWVPQIWSVFSWDTPWRSLRYLIDY